MDEMKKCTQCGVELEADALFCPDCGTRQEESAAEKVPEQASDKKESVQDAFVAPPETPPTPPVPPSPAAAPPQLPPSQPFSYNMPEHQPASPQGQPQMQQQQPYGMAPGQMPHPGPQAPYGNAPVPVTKPEAQGKKLPVFLLVVGGLLGIGLLFWVFRFFSTGMAAYSFVDEAARGVVFVALLSSILALISLIILRVQLRGKKLAILANVLMVMLILTMLFGIAITEFVEGDFLYNLFVKLVP